MTTTRHPEGADGRLTHDFEPALPGQVGQQPVGAVGQSVEMQHPGQAQIGHHHDEGGDRQRPDLGRGPPQATAAEPEQRARRRETSARPAGWARGRRGKGSERPGPPARQGSSSRREGPAGHDQEHLVGHGRHLLVERPRASRKCRPDGPTTGWTPSPTSSETTTVSPVRSTRARTTSAARSTTVPAAPWPATQGPSESRRTEPAVVRRTLGQVETRPRSSRQSDGRRARWRSMRADRSRRSGSPESSVAT